MSRDPMRPEHDDAETAQPSEQGSCEEAVSNAAGPNAAEAARDAGAQQQRSHPVPQAPAALGGMGSTGPITVVPPKR